MTASGAPPTDDEVMVAVRAGDAGQLGRLFERHHLALYEFLYRTVGDRTAAEDLVQDVFVRILKYRHTYRDGHPFVTWMYRIARNARADHFRRRQATAAAGLVDVADFDPASTAPSVPERLEKDAETTQLRLALRELPADKRELIVLARYQQLPYDQIAALFDVEVGTIKVRVHRALKQLRTVFDQRPTRRDSCDVKTPHPTSDRS